MAWEDEDEEEEAPKLHREMIVAASHFTECELDGAETVDRFLSCPVCLGLLRQPMATECLHRFCSDCIETSLRVGKKECPSCRFPISTRRALRRDENFEALMLTLFPEGLPEEEEAPLDLSQFQFKPLRPPSPSEVKLEPPPERKARAPRPQQLPRTPPVADHGAGDDGRPAMSEEKKRRPRGKKHASADGELPHLTALPSGGGDSYDGGVVERAHKWSCPICTLINSAQAKKCKVCEAPNPTLPKKARKGQAAMADGDGGAYDYEMEEADERDAQRKANRKARARQEEREGSTIRGKKAAAKRQRSLEVAEEERRKRQERLAARQPQRRKKEPEVTNAVRPEPALDVSDDAPSIEAQLLARQTFSLHVKNADEAGVVILWSFPTANPGNCSAWVSLAPALNVTEASARIKFKLITKNKMFGEVKFSWAEMMKLKDGAYAFGLHATMDGVQLALAVSTKLRKSESALVAEAEEEGAGDESMEAYGEEDEEGEEAYGEEGYGEEEEEREEGVLMAAGDIVR